MLSLLVLIAGLAGLWFGTQLTIRGAVSFAERLGISDFIIGVAILSIGSDIPELAVTIDASLKNLGGGDTSGVVVGTAIGSSLAQIGFVLGFAGLFGYLTLSKQVVYRHGSVMLGSIILLLFTGADEFVSRTEGASLVTVYLIYFGYLLTDKTGYSTEHAVEDEISGFKAAAFLLTGLIIVAASSELTVHSTVQIAETLGVNQALISIFLIGIGSSLPELSISLAAMLKKRMHLSVGNLIGSNIFDTLIPIGVGGMISTLEIEPTTLLFDLPALFVVSATALFYFAHVRGIQKAEAATLIGLYLAYAFGRLIMES